ncbi:MAG: molybdopterin molybdenumtransferase MoeA, partial [Desulfosarcinaceae bacterium]
MKDFFQVTETDRLLGLRDQFRPVSSEVVDLDDALDRVLGEDFTAPRDLPGFDRATMDGFAVPAASTFGASEGSPAYLTVVGGVGMGETPRFKVGPGQAARIATGGMLPAGTDSVVMIEHTEAIDEQTIEVYHSVAPGQNRVARDEDA